MPAAFSARGRGWPDDITARWPQAETALFNLPGMSDAYRATHPGAREFPVSHYTGRKPDLTGRRYDYIFASDQLNPVRCIYLSGWLQPDHTGWRPSDHAPVEAELTLPGHANRQ